MSTALHVYAVPFRRLQALRSGSEVALGRTILQNCAEILAEIDRRTKENVAEELEGYPEFLSCGTAVEQIVSSQPLNAGLGVVYMQAYELVCDTLSQGMVGEWSPIAGVSGDFFARLDRWLKECGAGVSVVNLSCRGPVPDLPEAVDFPSVGYWTPEEIEVALRKLQRADRGWWPWSRRKPPADLADSLADVRRWLEAAHTRAGAGLVGVQIY